MTTPPLPTTAVPPAARPARAFASAESEAILRKGFAQFATTLVATASTSIETSDDLFEQTSQLKSEDFADFRNKRGTWPKRFEAALSGLFEARLAGTRRKGRRPDADSSVASLHVLDDFDHAGQAALTGAASRLERSSKRELAAIELRVGHLLQERGVREPDNPFSTDYILDAIGLTTRAHFSSPRVWRALMERVIVDITPAVIKAYVNLNRFFTDQDVLPEIKAELRARSDLRPVDDRDLFPLFTQLFKDAGPMPDDPLFGVNIQVPAEFDREPGAERATFAFDASTLSPPGQRGGPAAARTDAVPAGAQAMPGGGGPRHEPARPAGEAAPGGFAFPTLNPFLAFGSSSPILVALDQWQHRDPAVASHAFAAAPGGFATSATLGAKPGDMSGADVLAALAALNRIPFIRAAMGDTIENPSDRITMDVIALLFDYIFRDPSIPGSLRSLFSRLQVPIAKAALIDRGFFSDPRHPARLLLDRLAAGSVGATGDGAYLANFTATATNVIDDVCRDYKADPRVFAEADRQLAAVLQVEQSTTESALSGDVAEALAAELDEADRSQVRAFIREKLTGLELPFEVRAFAETTWAAYLTTIRQEQGETSPAWIAGARTLDDLLWSISAKERSAQRARLTRMVPGLITRLRAACKALSLEAGRAKAFFEALYELHIAAIKPAPAAPARPRAADGAAAGSGAEAGLSPTGPQSPGFVAASAKPEAATPVAAGAVPAVAPGGKGNVHDFVSEMVAGTWVAFKRDDATVEARLFWISPLRSKYIFTSRSRSRAFVVTPEELAWELGAGSVALLLEPVPLFDRAVSAALDSLAAKKKTDPTDAEAPAAVH